MKKKQSHGEPVTAEQVKIIVQKIVDKLDKKFIIIDSNFSALNGKLSASLGINTMNIDRAVQASEDRLIKKIDKILNTLDSFIKRTEENEREINFLGKQHDDLAKYCTQKIAYPVYGRNL